MGWGDSIEEAPQALPHQLKSKVVPCGTTSAGPCPGTTWGLWAGVRVLDRQEPQSQAPSYLHVQPQL